MLLQTDIVFLGVFKASESVSLYSAAAKLLLPALAIPTYVGFALLPAVMSRIANRERPDSIITAIWRITNTLTLPTCVAGSLLADHLVMLVFGARYAASSVPFGLLIWSVLPQSAQVLFGFLLLVHRREGAYLRSLIAGAMCDVLLCLTLIPPFGMPGVAVATVMSWLVVMLVRFWCVRD